MVVYNPNENNEIYWPNPVEITWQHMNCASQRDGLASELAPKMPHLGLADIFFLGAVANMEERPHGLMTWTAEMFGLSRVSLYALKKRVNERLGQISQVNLAPPPVKKEKLGQYVEVSQERINRFVLTGMFPGNVSTRPMQELLKEALGQCRSVGWISQLRQEAGRRAGEWLSHIRYESMGPVVALRDETFFNGHPILIVMDPISTAIVGAYVCPDRTASTWATVLLEVTGQGLNLVGLVEDMATMYPQSVAEAELEGVITQKDVWHFRREGEKVCRTLERQAYAAMKTVYDLEWSLAKSWDDDKFEREYIPAVLAQDRRIDRYDNLAEWLAHLADALLWVDPASGDIRDFDTNHWLLTECLTAISAIDCPLTQAFVKKLKKYQYQLLAFLEWTAVAIAEYTRSLTSLLPHPTARQQFIRTAAKSWALKQALINGHSRLKAAAQMVQGQLDSVIQSSPALADAVQQLWLILDSSARASSLVEMVNGLLKSFLKNRKSFPSAEHLQSYLNLFVLWHNTRIYAKRNKRSLVSPFQLADIELPNSDWLTLLGFPPAQ